MAVLHAWLCDSVRQSSSATGQGRNELRQCLHARSVSLCDTAVKATVQPTSDVHFSSGVISSVGQLIDYETNPLRQLLMRWWSSRLRDRVGYTTKSVSFVKNSGGERQTFPAIDTRANRLHRLRNRLHSFSKTDLAGD